jgi:predicted RNA-binding protein
MEKKKKSVAVIDGQGGGIGSLMIKHLREALAEEVEIIGLGTNAMATGAMLKAGANKGASGENAIVQTVKTVDVIIGTTGILLANSMMGELTPKMAEAIASSPAMKYLLPLRMPEVEIIGAPKEPLPHLVNELIKRIKEITGTWHPTSHPSPAGERDRVREQEEKMCEANAYLMKEGKEELVLEDISILRPEKDELYLQNIFGEQKRIKARIKEMNLIDHRILLEES